MHLTVINGPFRTAALGSRIPCSLSPFILSSSSNTAGAPTCSSFPALHQQCKYSTARSPRAQPPQRQQRHASTGCNGQPLFKFQHNPASRIPNRSTFALLHVSAAATTTTTTATSPRKFSTQAPSSSTSSSASGPSAHSSTPPENLPLDWNSFFRLRASRRKYSLVSSIVASVFSTAGGVQVFAANNMDSIGAQALGLDPFIVLGLATASCAALGWLLGPVLGNSLWGLVHRKYKAAVAMVCLAFSFHLHPRLSLFPPTQKFFASSFFPLIIFDFHDFAMAIVLTIDAPIFHNRKKRNSIAG